MRYNRVMKINESKLERFFAEFEFASPYLLCCSDCESLDMGELLSLEENAEEEFKGLWLGYTESLGNPKLREEIAAMYPQCGADHVMVLAGAEEGIFLYMNALLEPGDHLIVQFPTYQSLYEIARGIGCDVTPWHQHPGTRWEVDIDFLARSITPKTKGVVINFPANPTGAMISKEEFQKIIEIADTHGLIVFSDEVYRYLEYDGNDRLPSMCDVYPRSVSLGVMSKSFGLPGLRIGWTVTKEKALFDKMAALKDFTTICCSGPSEFLSTLALRHKETILERNRKMVMSNLQLLESFFHRHSKRFDYIRPEAGPLAFPRLRFTEDADAFCMDLLEKTGVLLAPGSKFDYKKDHVRFGFGRKNMPEALQKLEDYFV